MQSIQSPNTDSCNTVRSAASLPRPRSSAPPDAACRCAVASCYVPRPTRALRCQPCVRTWRRAVVGPLQACNLSLRLAQVRMLPVCGKATQRHTRPEVTHEACASRSRQGSAHEARQGAPQVRTAAGLFPNLGAPLGCLGCLGFHYAKPTRRTRKRGTEQLARTKKSAATF